jgi:hypothetical protein
MKVAYLDIAAHRLTGCDVAFLESLTRPPT